jgi:heterodisulfide reductase subunit B
MPSNNKYLLFLGCAIPYRVSSYEVSSRKILTKLGIDITEMPEFNCCGLPLDPINHEAMLLLAAKNLAHAEQQNLNIIALCTGCASTLNKVNQLLKKDNNLRQQINEQLKEANLEFKGTIETKHLLQFLKENVGIDKIKAAVTNPFIDLKVAEHNGCHLLRPKQYNDFDNPENPQTLKTLIEATGAACIEYVDPTQCCGAPSVGVNDKIALQLARDKLLHIKDVQAQALITVCPFCHIMYDTNELRIEKLYNETYNIPIIHYPQLLGLALGLKPEELAFNDLRVDPKKFLEQTTTK